MKTYHRQTIPLSARKICGEPRKKNNTTPSNTKLQILFSPKTAKHATLLICRAAIVCCFHMKSPKKRTEKFSTFLPPFFKIDFGWMITFFLRCSPVQCNKKRIGKKRGIKRPKKLPKSIFICSLMQIDGGCWCWAGKLRRQNVRRKEAKLRAIYWFFDKYLAIRSFQSLSKWRAINFQFYFFGVIWVYTDGGGEQNRTTQRRGK